MEEHEDDADLMKEDEDDAGAMGPRPKWRSPEALSSRSDECGEHRKGDHHGAGVAMNVPKATSSRNAQCATGLARQEVHPES